MTSWRRDQSQNSNVIASVWPVEGVTHIFKHYTLTFNNFTQQYQHNNIRNVLMHLFGQFVSKEKGISDWFAPVQMGLWAHSSCFLNLTYFNVKNSCRKYLFSKTFTERFTLHQNQQLLLWLNHNISMKNLIRHILSYVRLDISVWLLNFFLVLYCLHIFN